MSNTIINMVDPNIKNDFIRCRNLNFYDSLFDALTYIRYKGQPISKYKISNNSKILKMLVECEFIIEVMDDKQKSISKSGKHKYYNLSSKGQEYIMLYEKIQELLKRNEIL